VKKQGGRVQGAGGKKLSQHSGLSPLNTPVRAGLLRISTNHKLTA
jgi:hypothetical protein